MTRRETLARLLLATALIAASRLSAGEAPRDIYREKLAGQPRVIRFYLGAASLFGFASGGEGDLPRLPGIVDELAALREVKVVCFGDSVTGVYYHTGGRRAYSHLVELGLRQAFPGSPVTVINAGVSGNSTREGLARIQKDVLDQRPRLVTVMFGLNDMVRVPIAEFDANLRKIVAHCREGNVEVMLCTPNAVIDTDSRPRAKLVEYCETIRRVAREEHVALCDTYAALESLRERQPRAWRLLMSDEIHPNMDGHKRMAEEICLATTGRAVELQRVPPPAPAIPRTLARLKSGEPIKVRAMPPYDAAIETALRAIEPNARLEIQPWRVNGQSLAQLEESAKEVRNEKPDLVVIAVPVTADAETEERRIHSHSWIMNWALSFGLQEWDVLAIPPSVARSDLSRAEREQDRLIRQLIHAQHLAMPDRPANDRRELADWLTEWLKGQR